MDNATQVIECLQALPSKGCCDDCLARKTGIRSKQQVSQICRTLAADGTVTRKKGKCPLGDHTKVISTLVAKRVKSSRRSTGSARRGRKSFHAPAPLGIEDAWRYVDRFCRALWVKHMETQPPASLAEAITVLRDEELVPAHEAGMMHTIRTLRNLLVHEVFVFGDHESMIVQAAWQIIRVWAEQEEEDAWRLAITMCTGRAA